MRIEDDKFIVDDPEEQRLIYWALAEYCNIYHKDNKAASQILNSMRDYMKDKLFTDINCK
ncbi:hypothetical protein EAL2_c16650 [Peptoclostridium acidaminophilum DSM 3953]|uniref:Uncharacterized protein n=1 Tax=Peptoclostridium acidaminophilum DSM 3953 TaxID=1286171 RepID=W8T7T2_PEPAC|nr:hypothetical protein [Peptoclostridium acidaminophilum]AHM56960.1 hypothetical protein EAL2_c16650 [Peptoclostridium acidaminophilum DSM 3953]